MMKNDLAGAPPEQENAAKESRVKKGLTHIWRALSHNWGWKIASLALAVCLWGALISQDTALPRDKIIEDIRVSVTNSAAPRNNGLIVVSGLDELDSVSIRASVPQRNYTTAGSAHYSARLDLSQIQTVGEQTIKVTVTTVNATQYGTVKEVLNPDVTVVVEELESLSGIPVEVRREGEVPEGYFAAAITRSVEFVDVSGPKSVVEKISRCVLTLDQSSLNPNRSPNTVSLAFTFEDMDGNALDGSRLTVTPQGQSTAITRITVSQEVYYSTQVPIAVDALYKGEPAEGYAVSSVRVTPQTVTLAGSKAAIAPYQEEGAALYPFDQVDITGQKSTVSQLLYLNTPGNMEYISNNAVQVVVTILPEMFVNVDTGEVTRITEQNP
ncbi:MAG: hypothetical protein IKQ41_09185 [Clostridia bacterium]|nr:hypothetical protein [Clostridia bacterium]